MEEQILVMLEGINKRFDGMEQTIVKEFAKMKEELKQELKRELKQELKEELVKELKEELTKVLKEELKVGLVKLKQELKEELTRELKEELAKELKKELARELKKELAKELKEELAKELKKELTKYLKKEILDFMFVFETEYGRKLTIAFEELSHKSMKEEIQNRSIANLEKISEMNTAYVYSHEERIDKLENHQIKVDS